VGGYAFAGCEALTDINLPACTSVDEAAFEDCTSLTAVSLPVCTSLGKDVFENCNNLTSLYLTSVSSVPTLGSSAFKSTPIGGYSASAGQYGSVFVPASLLTAFQSAPNWSSISSRMVGL
jgi:hypothetical protein